MQRIEGERRDFIAPFANAGVTQLLPGLARMLGGQ
jgi:hypothetical protein